MDKLKPDQPSLFGYRTDVSLRAGSHPSRWSPTWLVLVGSVVIASGLVFGVLYWLVTVDAQALGTALRELLRLGAH